MATVHGKLGKVDVDGNFVAEFRKFSIDVERDTAEDTASGDSWKSFLAGMRGWSGSIECMWDVTDADGQELLAGDTESITAKFYPEGNASAKKYLTGSIIITKVGSAQDMGDVNTRSYDFQGTGALTTGTEA